MGGGSDLDIKSSSISDTSLAHLSAHSKVTVDVAERFSISHNYDEAKQSLLQIRKSTERDISIYTLILTLDHKNHYAVPSDDSTKRTQELKIYSSAMQSLLSLIDDVRNPVIRSELLCFAADKLEGASGDLGLPSVKDLLLRSKAALAEQGKWSVSVQSVYLFLYECYSWFWTIAIPSVMAFCSYLVMKIAETTSGELSKSISGGVGKFLASIPLSLVQPAQKPAAETDSVTTS